MSKTTAIVNQKDGIGKTNTALNLGYALSEKGKRYYLLILIHKQVFHQL